MKSNLTNALSKRIKAAGFKKKALNWSMQNGDLIHLINLQKSRFNIDEESFAVNIGIFSGDVHKLIWNEKEIEPKEVDCVFRKRLDFFCSEKSNNGWFVLKNEEDVEVVLNDINECISSKILPFIAGLYDKKSLFEYLRGKPYTKQDYLYMIQLSCLAFFAGDINFCNSLLTTVIQDGGPWKEKALIVKRKLGT